MARLRRPEPEDAAFSDDCDPSSQLSQRAPSKPSVRSSPRKKAAKSYHDHAGASDSDNEREARLQPKTTPRAALAGKQRRLAPLHAASLSKPLHIQPLLLSTRQPDARRSKKSLLARNSASSPRKSVTTPPLSDPSDAEETVEVEVEESIWCGSDATSESEDELPSPRKFLHFRSRPKEAHSPQKSMPADGEIDLARRLDRIKLDDGPSTYQPLQKVPDKFKDICKDTSRPGTSSDKENNDAILRFSPPRLYSPPKNGPGRPVTPPQSPTKSRLQSPTKTKTRVPSPKIRQSLDAFWSTEAVNEWNDQYSPRKVLKSPRKLRLVREESSSPSASPRKAQSPTKRTKAEREAKQAFEDRKHAVAEAFLTELDKTITAGKIRSLAASTGGVRFIWSKTLNSTAGRANWRRETTKIRNLDGTTETLHKHHASIELAEKVINDEHRLLNVIAHEFCHLANFMVSGIKDQPHGAQFKAWGRMCTKNFGARGVEVTTKHSYEIEYKYVWVCSGEDCGSEFKRHSKSIDPKRHSCGSCRSKLVQIKPTPRNKNEHGGSKGAEGKETGGFAAFVKQNFAATKQSFPPGSTQKTVMEALGKAYRAQKAQATAAAAVQNQASSCRQNVEAAAAIVASGVPEAVKSSGERGASDGMERLAEDVSVIEICD